MKKRWWIEIHPTSAWLAFVEEALYQLGLGPLITELHGVQFGVVAGLGD